MGKTRDLFKKTADIKGTFHACMSTINDRNSKGLTEADEIAKWKEYRRKNYTKKVLTTQITMTVWSF